MTSPADIARDQDEGLRQLFQAGLELALQVQANAMAAEPAEQAKLATAFHRISRGVRQTAALRMKLACDVQRAERETTADIIRLDDRRIARRKGQLKAAVGRLIWTEADSDDREDLGDNLDVLLDIEAQDEAFESEPLAAQVERICRTLGLPVPPLQGEVSAKPTEGVEAHAPLGPASQPPQSLRDSSPSGGASEDDDPLLSDDYWRSSA